jgi:UDP-glucose 4-epimerase
VIIYGDGEQTRDFVNVRDVAQANYKAAMTDGISGAYNIASGSRITINVLYKMMDNIVEGKNKVEYHSPRQGDVLHSLADIALAKTAFSYNPIVSMQDGLEEYLMWFKDEIKEEN